MASAAALRCVVTGRRVEWKPDDDGGFLATSSDIGAAVGPNGRWLVEVWADGRWGTLRDGRAATVAEAREAAEDAMRAAAGEVPLPVDREGAGELARQHALL